MKKYLIAAILVFGTFLIPSLSIAQCQFNSLSVELNDIHTDSNGNCVLNFNLGFEIDINNGNKIIFVHLWRSVDYSTHTYSTQNQPTESNILNDALATIIIDNDVVNNNPSAPANQVFKTVYGPDPGIDDNTAPAINQVKDASDGLTYNRVDVNAAQNIYRYTINNLTLTLPGVCDTQVKFTGDAWSSNANSVNPAIQCSMQGFSFLATDPIISSTFACQPIGTSNTYSYTVSTTTNQQLSFNSDVYVDNGDNFFDALLDTKVVADAGPYLITSGAPFNSGTLTYDSLYSTVLPEKLDNLWVVVKNITLTNNASIPPVITVISNSLIEQVTNTCNITVLPVTLLDFKGKRVGRKVSLEWKVIQTSDITGYTVQRKNGSSSWEDIAYIKAIKLENKELDYTLSDNNLFTDQSLYRLKIENEGNIDDFSRNVSVPGLEDNFSCTISPNPSPDGIVKVDLGLSKIAATIYLYDLHGRLLQTVRAVNSKVYELSWLQPGTYLIKIMGDNEGFNIWKKVVVLSR